MLDRIRAWLPPLLALSANSPYWQGEDTDYASYRSQVMGRWPGAGPVDVLGSAAAYDRLVQSLIDTGVLLDEGMVYFDVRRSAHHPTVEIRVPDVCLDVGDTVLVAALCRALVETAAREWAEGVPPADVPSPLIRFAGWRAARWGLNEDLLHPLTARPQLAHEVVGALVDHVRPVLQEAGDDALVDERLDHLFRTGNGATRQRAVRREGGGLGAVLAMLAKETVATP